MSNRTDITDRNERGEIDLFTLIFVGIILVLVYLATFTDTDVPALIATFLNGMVEVWATAISTIFGTA
ncbi:hypothetical protein FQ330_03270 [Agrococcus sediminis]|uniref:Uncharacterized protein n=1 Tax=Agrococcus sediminis TaxID=2599924 RepID=A0A5M8QMF1_9MICO|nr:hypothetical protein [Agrococcus sediminis]KAA6436438.1 hypothetical protein FQ330_03270 [Agrococcus sediminis]